MSLHPVESLSAFLDDELPDAERRGVAAHLAGCPSCALHLRELAALDALARGLPPAVAPDGYLEALPGRVRQRIRAHRPPSRRAPWVWPLAAGIALAVLAPLVLRQQLARERVSPGRPAVGMEAPAPPTTMAPEQGKPAAKAEGRVTRPPAPPPPPRREAAPGPKTRDAFAAAPPPLARANENDRAAGTASDEITVGVGGAPPAAPAAQEPPAAAGRLEEKRTKSAVAPAQRSDAPSSLKKEEASTPEEARRVREAWRRFVAHHPAGPRADEGRVLLIEAAVEVFRLSRDEKDRAIAESEGRAYLAIPGAPQASRVRDALRLLER